ncbi:peptidylprolyl isomerase [Sphingomonas kaistensis]|uniref:Peptidylprolyl isomerase n=1 Tax=Sphingomonas kaistensis TaxID=298708 RepID=A0ABZ2FYM7_9SPHN
MTLLLALAAAQAAPAAPKPLTPSEIVAQSPATAWREIRPEDLMVIDYQGGGRTIIELAPAFAPVHVANIRALAGAGYWNGASIYRVQDNYVTQWGVNEGGPAVPASVVKKPPAEYDRPLRGLTPRPLGYSDAYAPRVGHALGWPVAWNPATGRANLTHCYGMVGVGRDMAPDTGMGGELYAVIGHAPRHLDRNIALVGRLVEGIENMSALPRGTEALGIYKAGTVARMIAAVRLASAMPEAERPRFQAMNTASATFSSYVRARANRKDAFFNIPSGGVDLCNAPVPVRRTPAPSSSR